MSSSSKMFYYWPYLGGIQELLGSVGLLSLTHVLVCFAQRLELLMVLIQVVVLAYKGSEKGKKMVHTVESVSMFLVMATILFTSVSSHAMRPSGLRR